MDVPQGNRQGRHPLLHERPGGCSQGSDAEVAERRHEAAVGVLRLVARAAHRLAPPPRHTVLLVYSPRSNRMTSNPVMRRTKEKGLTDKPLSLFLWLGIKNDYRTLVDLNDVNVVKTDQGGCANDDL